MKIKFIFLLLCFCLGFSATAQQNQFQDTRNLLGLSAGTIMGLDGRLYISNRWFSSFQAGYFWEKELLGGGISLGYAWPIGLFQKNQLYTSLGYLSSASVNFIGASAQFGYRFQFGQSPFFLYTEWQPWLDEGSVFRPLAGQVVLAMGIKRGSKRRGDRKLNGFYNTAIGIKVGSLAGLSVRAFTAPRGAVQIELDYDFVNTASNFSITYSYNQPVGGVGLFTYANLGGGYQIARREDMNGERFTDLDSFLTFIAGLEYNIFALPLQVAVQWEPRYGIEKGLRLELASFLLRYTF